MPDKVIEAWVNPLAFLEVDEPWASTLDKAVTAETVVAYACPPGLSSDVESVVARYREISTRPSVAIVPAEQRLIERLVWPLRSAKAAYMLGNYLATIPLSGMVAEMTAILLWDATERTLNARPMNEADERALFGGTFEKLGQERRVKLLWAYQLVSAENRDRFDRIREHPPQVPSSVVPSPPRPPGGCPSLLSRCGFPCRRRNRPRYR